METLDAAIAAQRAGAHRLELCVQLNDGGTTPPADLIQRVAAAVGVPVFVLVRPRLGDFVYSAEEIDQMTEDVEVATAAGASGIVTGALTANGRIALRSMEILIAAAGGLPLTFHRAIDFTRDLPDALEDVISLGAARVLTSGGAATALEGTPVIGRLVKQAAERIAIVAGGGVRDHNVRALLGKTGVREVHARMVDEDSMTRLVAEARQAGAR